jgi:hypothetical protein
VRGAAGFEQARIDEFKTRQRMSVLLDGMLIAQTFGVSALGS